MGREEEEVDIRWNLELKGRARNYKVFYRKRDRGCRAAPLPTRSACNTCFLFYSPRDLVNKFIIVTHVFISLLHIFYYQKYQTIL